VTQSTIDISYNYTRQDSSIVNKNMILKENIQFIERIGEGKLGTGNCKFV